jgi:peptidoglycan/LPS O-acetylase OafA/YrhL
MKNRESRLRFVLAAVVIGAGVVWSVLFPKKASFDPDMVASVAIGAGLIGAGALLFLEARLGRVRTALAILLLWSLLANVYLYSDSKSLRDHLVHMQERASAPR